MVKSTTKLLIPNSFRNQVTTGFKNMQKKILLHRHFKGLKALEKLLKELSPN